MRPGLLAVVLVTISGPLFANERQLTADEWQADLDFAIERVLRVHPHPFGRTGAWELHAAARDLRREIPTLRREEIVVRLATLVARLQDGHTSLNPYLGDAEAQGFVTWFPVRFRQFTDGLFVTMASEEHRELIGARVLRLGQRSAEEALRRAGAMVPAENEHWVAVNAPLHLSSAEALLGLGVIDDLGRLPLTVRTRSGEERSITLASVVQPQSRGWFWRWLRGPGGTDLVHGFDTLPLHLASQVSGQPTYDFTYLPESKTLYFYLIGFWDAGPEDFFSFWERMWAFYDDNDVERVVFDLRVNGGGDGARVTRMVHSFIRRPELEAPGRVFVLTSGKTFSAAVMMVAAMGRHTQATVVGSPMGAGYNHHGDAGTVRLPASGLELHVSTLYHQLSRSDDDRRAISPHVPAPVASSDYFAGHDPALRAITSGAALRVTDQFRVHGADRALATLHEWQQRFGSLGWWFPFAERELNRTGYELLQAGRVADAQAAFQLNAETFPESSNVWDSLAESYLEAGDKASARKYYEKALEVDPGNGNAAAMLERLARDG